jgi:hypothetical protein
LKNTLKNIRFRYLKHIFCSIHRNAFTMKGDSLLSTMSSQTMPQKARKEESITAFKVARVARWTRRCAARLLALR